MSRRTPPQWFRVPSDTYFNVGAIDSLRELTAREVLIVTDAGCEARGVDEEIRQHLGDAVTHVFSDIEPEPREEQIRAGAGAEAGRAGADGRGGRRLRDRRGQGHAAVLGEPRAHAARAVAALPRRPQAGGALPGIEHKVKLAAVPTTAGTGSEVSPAAVLTADHRKVTLVDYSLVPDMAVVEPSLTLSMPPAMTADTGIDALTHALEAFVSIFASPYTDAFCLQAIHLILENLPRAYEDGSDLGARTAMANAATIAGLAFSNAFLGINHALAHSAGARFGIAHGQANAIFLPHVLRHNASLPTKFMPAPGYSAYVAPEKYAQIAWVIGLGGKTEEIARERLFDKVDELLRSVDMPASLAEAGVAPDELRAALPSSSATPSLTRAAAPIRGCRCWPSFRRSSRRRRAPEPPGET